MFPLNLTGEFILSSSGAVGSLTLILAPNLAGKLFVCARVVETPGNNRPTAVAAKRKNICINKIPNLKRNWMFCYVYRDINSDELDRLRLWLLVPRFCLGSDT